jgi:hypothetical protein
VPIPLDDPQVGALGRLAPGETGYPHVYAGERIAHRLHLPQVTAPVGVRGPQLGPVERRLRRRRERRAPVLEPEVGIAPDQLVPELEGFREEEAGVEVEHRDFDLVPRDHVDERAALHAERGRQRQPPAGEPAQHPGDDLLRRGIFADFRVGIAYDLHPGSMP